MHQRQELPAHLTPLPRGTYTAPYHVFGTPAVMAVDAEHVQRVIIPLTPDITEAVAHRAALAALEVLERAARPAVVRVLPLAGI